MEPVLRPVWMLEQADSDSTAKGLDETLSGLRNIIFNIAASALIPSNPRPSANKINDFVTQVALVMTGIRSGYLVDTLVVRLDRLARFLDELQSQAPSELAVCWEETTEQTFFINIRLFESRVYLKDFPSWVCVSQPPYSTSEPSFLKRLLDRLVLKIGSIHKFQTENRFDGCPLAAFLLEYPVAYVIIGDDRPFLSGVSLCIYDCMLDFLGERISIVKFSVPVECDSEDILSSLRDKFQQRIGKPIHITRTLRTFDRVAL